MKLSLKLVSLIFMFLLLMIAGCSSNETSGEKERNSDQISLRIAWWGSQDRHDKTQKVIELFEGKNPNIKVTAEFTGWDGYWQKLATTAAGGNLPDIIQMDYAYLMEYVHRDLIADLNPFVDSGILNLDDVADAYIEGGFVNDQLFAVNLGTNALAIAYDPAMFEEAGIEPFTPGYTWDDYEKAARQLREKLGPDAYGVEGAKNSLNFFNYYLRQHQLKLYSDDGQSLGFDDDQVLIDYLTFWNNLMKDGVAAPPDVTASVQGRLEEELIVHQKSPTLWFNSNQVVALQASAGREIKLTVLPELPGGEKGLYLKPAMFFSISKSSKQQEAAAKFIDFVTNDIEANEILAAERGVPIASKVRDHLKPQLGEATLEMFNYVELVEKHSSPIFAPEPAGHGEVSGLFDRLAEQLNFVQITPEEFVKEFREEGNKILQKNQ